MIRIQSLRKTYGDLVAVEDLSLEIAEGETLALLGPNGAGKSTTVNCLVGLQNPDSGTITVGGKDALRDPTNARHLLGYVPEVANIYEALTPQEYLTLKARLFEIPEDRIQAQVHRLLDGFRILERRHDPMVGFSKGMLQKVVLSAALITEPRALILDEPLSGLDVETTLVLKEIMHEFAARGGAVLYCSHLLDVVETVAQRVAILAQGRLVAVGTMAELRAKSGGGEDKLEAVFRQLTAASDPVTQARAILG